MDTALGPLAGAHRGIWGGSRVPWAAPLPDLRRASEERRARARPNPALGLPYPPGKSRTGFTVWPLSESSIASLTFSKG